jgi:diguanylate cyclase (GGDEF)-like protein
MPRKKPLLPTGDYDALYRRYLELTRQVDHLSTLREIGLAISGSLEMSETLAIIAHVVQGALDVSRLTILRPGGDGASLKPVIAKYGEDLIGPDRLEEESEPLRGSPAGEAMNTRTVVLVQDSGYSQAYVPLVAKNETLGIMVLQDQRDDLPFSQDDTRLFQQLGSQIAIAMHNAQLYALAVTDGLTGLYVRRYFDLRMHEEFAQAQRYKRAFSIMMFDIDHFKVLNDTHGHQTGDMVLKQVAELLRRNTRRSDICCRYGGEEMVVILPETDMNETAILATKLCLLIREHPFAGMHEETLSVTTSIGVAAYHAQYADPDAMVQAADQALYRAKESGRNRVELAGS